NKISVTQDKSLLNIDKEKEVSEIKLFLDSIMDLFHFLKPLDIDSKKKENELSSVLEIDSNFYNIFNELFLKLKNIISLYNKVRNYITQKPFSTSKFKLNFLNPTLLKGWDKNKEVDTVSELLSCGSDRDSGEKKDLPGSNLNVSGDLLDKKTSEPGELPHLPDLEDDKGTDIL
ncbi:MAG: hypothetical protein ACOC4H_01700, partial [bacterium]